MGDAAEQLRALLAESEGRNPGLQLRAAAPQIRAVLRRLDRLEAALQAQGEKTPDD